MPLPRILGRVLPRMRFAQSFHNRHNNNNNDDNHNHNHREDIDKALIKEQSEKIIFLNSMEPVMFSFSLHFIFWGATF